MTEVAAAEQPDRDLRAGPGGHWALIDGGHVGNGEKKAAPADSHQGRCVMDEHPVVVAYDGSPGAHAALRWAVTEATRRSASLRLVYALEEHDHSGPLIRSSKVRIVEEERCYAENFLAKAVVEVTDDGRRPLDVHVAVIQGPPAVVLCNASRGASVLVLGSRVPDGLAGLFVGSIGLTVSAHAYCPVVVIRDVGRAPDEHKPIAVGVDDSPVAQVALGFAFEEAAIRGARLLAIRASSGPPPVWPEEQPLRPEYTAEPQTDEQHMLDAALEGWRHKYPTVPVTTTIVVRDVRHALREATHDAQLMVVGARGKGGFPSLLLGSVSQYLLHHAACPVAVVRDTAESDTSG
jgi:nucleotide-binding universal stress UspA family protein